MTSGKNYRNDTGVGPMGAVATVPGDFISSAIFEVVNSACRVGGAIGRAAGRLNRR